MKSQVKNIFAGFIIAAAAMVTHSAVAAELSSFQKAARCSMLASVAGDNETAQQLAAYARLSMGENNMYFQSGYAAAVVDKYTQKTGDTAIVVSKKIFNASNCKALLPNAM
jgi:S-methylmethionine-dependent homocysteine/selenocysteine methylase